MATKLKVNYEFVGDSTTPVSRTNSIKHGDKMLNKVIDDMSAYVTPEMFGAKGDGVTDDTQAIQNTINSLVNGGCIYFGPKTYLCNSELTAPKSIVFKGTNRFSTKIKYTGSSTFIDQTGGDILGFENILMIGTSGADGSIFTSGSICFKAYNNSYSENSDFLYWNTISYWKGGYYHKHVNSLFRYSKILFDYYDQNCFSFFGCLFSNFEIGIRVKSGEGPITFVGGSIEYFAQNAFQSTYGRSICVNLIGTYFEEGSSESCPVGIESSSGKYDMGVVILSAGLENYSVNIIGCTVFVDGIFRFLFRYETSENSGITFTSKGNTFISRGYTTNVNCIYDIGGSTNSIVDVHDTIVGDFAGGFDKYISGYNANNLDGSKIYNPFTKKYLKPISNWLDLPLMNGAKAVSGHPPKYRVYEDINGYRRIELKGAINAEDASSNAMAILPEGSRPSDICSVACANFDGEAYPLSFYPSGYVVVNVSEPFSKEYYLGYTNVSID